MGTVLPFLPFITDEENKQFAECVLRNDFPIDDEDKAAIEWCKYVDGVKIFPKLPVHIRIHCDEFERNQRVRNCVERAREGQEVLEELNDVIQPVAPAVEENVVDPEALPEMNAQAMHNSPYVVTNGTAVGDVPNPTPKRKIGERGRDRKQRAPRPCSLCSELSSHTRYNCKRKGNPKYCEYWELDKTPKM